MATWHVLFSLRCQGIAGMILASMQTNDIRTKKTSPITRRTFLKNGTVLTLGVAALSHGARAQTNKNSKLRIFQIGAGGIAGLERSRLKGYPAAGFAGFCDVDENELNKVAAEYPGSFKAVDYREAFAQRANDFDAVIVETPDFHHAPMMLTAMKHGKHIYGQKPLVHQLDELRLMREGLKARPELVTQMGNQRACNKGRMESVEILRKNQLGKPVEAYVWTGGVSRGHYFVDPWSASGLSWRFFRANAPPAVPSRRFDSFRCGLVLVERSPPILNRPLSFLNRGFLPYRMTPREFIGLLVENW